MILRLILCLLCGYGFGCISTGYIVGKMNHVDIRNYGSGNIGTTNTLRTLGKKAGAITYIGDVAKAMVPMLLARLVIFKGEPYADLLGLYVGLGVAVGHNFPFWLHFKGGKGIAVTSGVMAAHDPLAIPLYIVAFVASVAITKYVSVGSLVIVTIFPIWIAVMDHGEPYFLHTLIVSLVFMGLAYLRHRQNLIRIKNGTENRIGQKVSVVKGNDGKNQDA